MCVLLGRENTRAGLRGALYLLLVLAVTMILIFKQMVTPFFVSSIYIRVIKIRVVFTFLCNVFFTMHSPEVPSNESIHAL